MFDKLRFSYHLSICERLIRNNKFIDHDTYEVTKRFKKHRTKLIDILNAINKKKDEALTRSPLFYSRKLHLLL